jgi:hypothetical protein
MLAIAVPEPRGALAGVAVLVALFLLRRARRDAGRSRLDGSSEPSCEQRASGISC